MLNFTFFMLSSSNWKISLTSPRKHSWHDVPSFHSVYLSCNIIFICNYLVVCFSPLDCNESRKCPVFLFTVYLVSSTMPGL